MAAGITSGPALKAPYSKRRKSSGNAGATRHQLSPGCGRLCSLQRLDGRRKPRLGASGSILVNHFRSRCAIELLDERFELGLALIKLLGGNCRANFPQLRAESRLGGAITKAAD